MVIRENTIEILEMVLPGSIKENKHTKSFIVEDMANILFALGNNPAKIVNIINYDANTQEEKEDMLKIIINGFKDTDYLITIASYVSTKEFPKSKYYMEGEEYKLEDKKLPVPIYDILRREHDLFEKCGFISVNDYVQYEYREAFIYPNKIGQQVREEIDKIIGDDN